MWLHETNNIVVWHVLGERLKLERLSNLQTSSLETAGHTQHRNVGNHLQTSLFCPMMTMMVNILLSFVGGGGGGGGGGGEATDGFPKILYETRPVPGGDFLSDIG